MEPVDYVRTESTLHPRSTGKARSVSPNPVDAPHLLKDVYEEENSKTESPSQPNSPRQPPDTFTHLLTQPPLQLYLRQLPSDRQRHTRLSQERHARRLR